MLELRSMNHGGFIRFFFSFKNMLAVTIIQNVYKVENFNIQWVHELFEHPYRVVWRNVSRPNGFTPCKIDVEFFNYSFLDRSWNRLKCIQYIAVAIWFLKQLHKLKKTIWIPPSVPLYILMKNGPEPFW